MIGPSPASILMERPTETVLSSQEESISHEDDGSKLRVWSVDSFTLVIVPSSERDSLFALKKRIEFPFKSKTGIESSESSEASVEFKGSTTNTTKGRRIELI